MNKAMADCIIIKTIMDTITLNAYGKINIGLDVTGRRDDGYHLVRMIMQTVDICDEVTVTVRPSAGFTGGAEHVAGSGADTDAGRKADANTGRPEDAGQITLTCDVPEVPTGRDNIAWKAAAALADIYGLKQDIDIHIIKRIPMAAGMAGGSTDAAAVITALNTLCGLNMSQEEMDSVALKLGADVPFCLRRGTWLSEGIGEQLTRLDDAPPCYVLIANPPVSVSTGEVYRALDAIEAPQHPDIDAMIGRIEDRDLQGLASVMDNILALVTQPLHPEIEVLRQKMMDHGALGSLMTGSGPTVFGLFDKKEKAEEALREFEKDRFVRKCFITGFVSEV